MGIRWSVFLMFAIFVSLPLGAQDQPVKAEEIWMDIPTYAVGPADPNPPLWNSPLWKTEVYPYPMKTDITRRRQTEKHRVIVLENRYTRVLILPDKGGKILAAIDKTNNDFDFIYYNQVIKPGLISLAGAWLSGGIEWNFPTYGHTVHSFSPVNHAIRRNGDGSATVFVGTEEWVRRMKWVISITLFPDRSCVKTGVRLYNGTFTHNHGYFWADAATHAWNDTRIVFPPSDSAFTFKRRSPDPWPVAGGIDLSWYKNSEMWADHFCATPGDFNGVYNYEKENGTVHFADRYESLGKKFFTWGTAPSGAIWEKLLTDSSGQFMEIQSGRMVTQGDSWIFEPHLVEKWDEYWYGVKKMGGFVQLNPDAAVNLKTEGEKLAIALNVTRKFRNAEVRLYQGGETVFSEKLDIGPEGFYARKIDKPARSGLLELVLLDENGKTVISHSTAVKKPLPAEIEPNPEAERIESPEMDYLRGYAAFKNWKPDTAEYHFQKALAKDPGFAAACRWLGIIAYQTGRVKEAAGYLQRSLNRDEDDLTARYYRALCDLNGGNAERAEADLRLISRRSGFRHVAPYLLAGIEIKRGDLHQAAADLESVVRSNPDDLKARVALSALHRRLGEKEKALEAVDHALKEDPLLAFGLIEKRLLTGRSDLEILRGDSEYYIEAADDYADLNLLEDAIATLQLSLANGNGRTRPMVYYHLGYLQRLAGKDELAEECFAKGSACSPEYVFPFRLRSETVLRQVIDARPGDWKPYYYLGNLLTSRRRWEEGLASFQKAASFSPSFPVLYRNLGEIYWRKLRSFKQAETEFEKAVRFAPADCPLSVSLDELYAINGNRKKREALFRKAPPSVKGNFTYVLQRALYFHDTERYDEALDALAKNSFLPWEGWSGAKDLYTLAHLARAGRNFRSGKFQECIRDVEASMAYPENLGSGARPDIPNCREFFLIGLARERLGDRPGAENSFRKAVEETGDRLKGRGVGAEQGYYLSLAMRKLGKTADAEKLLSESLAAAGENIVTREGAVDAGNYLWAAMAASGLGQNEKSDAFLKKARELDPSNRWIPFFSRLRWWE